MKPVVLVVACCLAFVMSGCGSDSGDSGDTVADPAASATLPTLPTQAATDLPTTDLPTTDPVLPDCAQVWVAEAKLPRGYTGCARTGVDVLAEPILCEYGLTIVTYGHRFYATPGRVINDVGNLKRSDKYQRALASCQG